MGCPSWTLHYISHLDPDRLAAPVTDPSAASFDLKDLAILVGMPICPRARKKRHMVTHDSIDGPGHPVHIDIAREGVGGFGGAATAGLGGVLDDGAGHGVVFGSREKCQLALPMRMSSGVVIEMGCFCFGWEGSQMHGQ